MNFIERTMNKLSARDKEKIMRNISRPRILIKETHAGLRAILTVKETCGKKELLLKANTCKRALQDLDYELPTWVGNKPLSLKEKDLKRVNKIVELICSLETVEKEFIDNMLTTLLIKFEN